MKANDNKILKQKWDKMSLEKRENILDSIDKSKANANYKWNQLGPRIKMAIQRYFIAISFLHLNE